MVPFQKQYEAYLLRVYANHRRPGSITGDSGIVSQNEDKYTRKVVVMAQPDIAETRSVSSPRMHPSVQLNQSRSTSTSKLHDQTPMNGTSFNHPPILPTTPLSAPFGADYHQTHALPEPHVYVSPVGQSSKQFAQVLISPSDTRQYSQTISDYDGNAFRSLQDANFRPSYTKAPILPITSLDQIQPNTVPVDRFFREHVESVQAATSGLSMQFPAGDAARYEEMSQNEAVPRQFDSLPVFRDANTMLSSSQSRIRKYDPSNIPGPNLMTAKSSTYRVDPNTSVIDEVGPLPGYMDYITASPQKSEDEGSIRSLTSDDVDDLIRHNEHLLRRSADGTKTPRSPIDVLGLYNANLDENGRTTAILENELDRYIGKIRKLHREHGVPSLEELDHEQNTSGDLLNASLSEDAAELPTEDRTRKKRVSEEMDRILALANDLASRRTGLKEVAPSTAEQNGNDSLPAEVTEDEIRHREVTPNGTLQFEEKREAEGRGISVENEIREDIATHSTDLEQTRINTETAKEDWNNAGDLAESRERDREISKKDDTHEKAAASLNSESRVDDPNNASEKEQFDLVTGEESNIEGLFDVAEELAPWNLASVQKEVRELHLDDPDEDRVEKDSKDTENRIVDELASESHVSLPSSNIIEQSGADDEVKDAHLQQDTLSHTEMESKKDVSESHETRPSIEDAEDVTSQISNQHEADESKIASQINEKLSESKENNDEKQDNDEKKSRLDDPSENAIRDNNVEQEYIEKSSQERQYEQDSTEQYHYDQGMPYEGVNNEEYERYVAQGYAQEGQEYVGYVDGQYEQYPEDPNNPQYQHDPNAQYEQDPNQAYDYNYDPNQAYGDDPNQQYNPNQGYGDDPNQQYDPNQGYGDSSGNQAYDYTEQAAYDPSQVYDNTYEQEYKEEQHNPDNVVVENREEVPETEEISQRQADPISEHKSSKDEDESQQVDAVNGTKKKKDVIKSLLDSDTDTTIERNVSNTESDFDFN